MDDLNTHFIPFLEKHFKEVFNTIKNSNEGSSEEENF